MPQNTSADISFTTESQKNLPILEKTMFHKSFVSGDHIEELPEVANESVDLFASIIDDPSSVGPASPGIDNTRK